MVVSDDRDISDFKIDGFDGIDNSFTNVSVVSRSSHNLLLKAMRYGQWWMLKCLLPEEKGQSVFQQMLRKEFEILIHLQHPNIVRAYSIEPVDNYGLCIVMEWLEGETLQDFLNKENDPSKCLQMVDQLIDAIDYMHKNGVVHRDIKPNNIMVSRNANRVKLIDFGLADSNVYAFLKHSGGTKGYMSPEQEEGGDSDIRNDIYSFGVILKKMNLGKRFAPVVNGCLEPIDRRYSTIKEVEDAIRARTPKSSKLVSIKWLWITSIAMLVIAAVAVYTIYRLNLHGNKNLSSSSDEEEYEEYVPEDLKIGEEPTLNIVNPDFHSNSTHGWNVSSNIHPGLVNSGNITACNFYIQTFDIWQTVHNLEPGEYELSVHAFHRPDSGNWSKWHYEHAEDKENGTVYSTAELYADTVSVRILNWAAEANSEPLPDDPIFCEELVKDEIPNALTAAGYYFNKGHYLNKLRFTLEGKDSVKIGLRLPSMRENSLSWVAFDTFRLRLIK